jgi:hypothetical protein
VDLDLVVEASDHEALSAWLKGAQFRIEKRWQSRAKGSRAAVDRWRRGPLILDILSGAVRDREAKVDIPARWVARDARPMRIVLLSASTREPFPVARPEALWALKIQAGRPQDLADLFALIETRVQMEEVNELFQSLWCPSLARKLERVVVSLGDEKIYRDACSRRALGTPRSPRNRRDWEAFGRRVAAAIPSGRE